MQERCGDVEDPVWGHPAGGGDAGPHAGAVRQVPAVRGEGHGRRPGTNTQGHTDAPCRE